MKKSIKVIISIILFFAVLPSQAYSQNSVSELDDFINRLVREGRFSGTVLLAKEGKTLFKKAYGLASRRFNVKNKNDTKFNLGSMNKMFTSVSIAQLVELGKLSYEDNVGKYLGPEWVKTETGQKVKIKHLLSHTSGLGSYFNNKFMESSRLKFRSVNDYKQLVSGETLAFEPGTRWSYSNTGMLLLGAVIEKITQQSYFDYVKEYIFIPAGMLNTDSYEMDSPVPNLAIGYLKPRGSTEVKNNIFMHVVKGGPAGGGFSTAEDLLKFDTALRTNKLLKQESRELLTTAKPDLQSLEYGYGFGIKKYGNDTRVGHTGGFPGIRAVLDMFMESGYTIIVLSNYTDGFREIREKMTALAGIQ